MKPKTFLQKSGFTIVTLVALYGGVDTTKLYQDAAAAVPLFQLVAFSTMAVNNGLAIAKQLGNSKDQAK